MTRATREATKRTRERTIPESSRAFRLRFTAMRELLLFCLVVGCALPACKGASHDAARSDVPSAPDATPASTEPARDTTSGDAASDASSDALDGASAVDAAPPRDASAEASVSSNPSACPAGLRSIAEGGRCTIDDLVCDYPRGSCACTMDACATPAGPTPGCVPALHWRCRHDGCPARFRGACSREGQMCVSDDGFCATDMLCRKGHWIRARQPSCRPAAPPRP